MKISVIIPCYNCESTLKECLDSVLKNTYKDFEVLVIDDKSTDSTRKIAASFKDKRLKLLINSTNSGASFSRNNGIKNSQGDIILLLDSDSYVPIDWINKHASLHKNYFSDIIGGGVKGIHNTTWGKADNFCNWLVAIPNSKNYYLKKLHLPTNNLSIKKSVFSKIGYFNENLHCGGEDAEFCFRALKANLKIYFQSNLIVYHYDRNDFQGFIKHQENWGKHAVKMRKQLDMDYSFLMPSSYFASFFYIFPLAFLYTGFIVKKWIKYQPSILIYSPVIFLGKLKQTLAIKDSFKH